PPWRRQNRGHRSRSRRTPRRARPPPRSPHRSALRAWSLLVVEVVETGPPSLALDATSGSMVPSADVVASGRARLGRMRALRKTAPRPGAELRDVPVPEPGEGEVLVRVHAASICGTDLHIFEWNEWAQGRVSRVPMTFGHEVAGTVEAVGPEVHHVQQGAFVA